MRTSVFVSAIIHLAGLVVLFAVRTPAPLIIPGSSVVQVHLVQPPVVQPTPVRKEPPPAPRPPEREAPKIKPVEETGIKITPPEEKKKAPEPEPKAEPSPPLDRTLPMARVGPAGLSGSMRVDAANFEFTYYLLLVRNRVAQNWEPPTGLVSGGEPIRAVVYFKIGRDGQVFGSILEEGSGREFFDRSAVRAVLLSDPMPPLPVGFDGSDLGVHFGFEYAAP